MSLLFENKGLVLWQVNETSEELLAQLTLNDTQVAALGRIMSSERRSQWLAARVIAKRYFNTTIGYFSDGAPYLEDSSWSLSLSHTGDTLAFYTHDKPCGVDIECNDRNAFRVARKFTTDAEVMMAHQIYPSNPALLLWCAKEALYKMCRVPGAEFKTDFCLLRGSENELVFKAFEREVILNYMNYNELLIVKND